ncbi:hypothetical protein BG006_008068 [Podila minutissima]|uniref:Uncharacterized protein n=1 Tax=Podila minutissima TaxID=64525 RepID=A0A9P5SVM0_9FUNG|nr:hypothetical protein BG006_008068 [Podila minutissima]
MPPPPQATPHIHRQLVHPYRTRVMPTIKHSPLEDRQLHPVDMHLHQDTHLNQYTQLLEELQEDMQLPQEPQEDMPPPEEPPEEHQEHMPLPREPQEDMDLQLVYIQTPSSMWSTMTQLQEDQLIPVVPWP